MKDKQIKKREQILLDLFTYRALTVGQIKHLYYKEQKITSCYTQLYRMKKEGYVGAKPLVRKENGTKEAACYYIRTKGIRELLEKGLIEKGRKEADNLPAGKDLEMVIDTNELYVQLKESGYKFIESREWKVNQSINYSSYVRGGLETTDGKQYAVYILNANAKEETLKKIKKEVDKEKQTGRFMIFSKGAASYTQFVRNLESGELGKIEYCVMPYNFIALRLPLFSEKRHFENLLAKYGTVEQNIEKTDTNSFAEYMLITPDGQEYYICNYLLLDEANFERAKKYPKYDYENSGRKALIICWQELTHLTKDVENKEHIEVLPINVYEKFQDHPEYEEILRREKTLDFRHPHIK